MTFWSWLKDPFGRKRIRELEERLQWLNKQPWFYEARAKALEDAQNRYFAVWANRPGDPEDITYDTTGLT